MSLFTVVELCGGGGGGSVYFYAGMVMSDDECKHAAYWVCYFINI